MQMSGYPGRMTFGLLPEPEGRSAPFVTSVTVNVIILGLMHLYRYDRQARHTGTQVRAD